MVLPRLWAGCVAAFVLRRLCCGVCVAALSSVFMVACDTRGGLHALSSPCAALDKKLQWYYHSLQSRRYCCPLCFPLPLALPLPLAFPLRALFACFFCALRDGLGVLDAAPLLAASARPP